MFRRYLYIALAVGITAGFIGLGSALFTDNQSVADNTFTSGTVQISTNPTTSLVTFSNMAPGDQVVNPITVTNDGTLNLRYAITSTATNADSKGLMGQLVLIVKSGVTSCVAGIGGFDAAGAPGGVVLYTGALGDASTSGLSIVGNTATGVQAGDRVLPPTTLNSEVLCFKVMLPSDTGDAFQGATTTATFNFVAEQTTNNP